MNPRMRLPRFRLRTLMIAVAIAGIALAVHRLYSRWNFYRRWVASATIEEMKFRDLAANEEESLRNSERMLRQELERPEETDGEADDWRSSIEWSRHEYQFYNAWAEWYATKKRLSRRAMTHLWEAVPAMPLEPQEMEWPPRG